MGAMGIMGLFLTDNGLIMNGAQMLRWQVSTTAFAGIVLLMTVLFQATGKVIPSFVMSISRQGVVFLAALLVCVRLFAYDGILMAQAVADCISAAIAIALLIVSKPVSCAADVNHS